MSIRKSGGKTGQAATAALHQAQAQFNQLNRALQSARDSLALLHGTIRAPVPGGGKRTVSGSRSRPTLLESAAISSIGGFLGRSLVSEGGGFFDSLFAGGDPFAALDAGLDFTGDAGGGSFLPSQSQIAGQVADSAARGQRVR